MRNFLRSIGRGIAGACGTLFDLAYGGVLTDPTGTPLVGSKNIQVLVWDAATGGSQVCATTPAAQTLVAGAFQVVFPDTCAAVVHSKTDLWTAL